MIKDDIELIIETLNGSIESFDMLMEKYQNKMFNLAYQITHDEDVSKDIVQDSFFKAYKKLKVFDRNRKFFSWIYRITLNESLNCKKRYSYSTELNESNSPTVSSPCKKFELEETAARVQSAINKLSPKYRKLIILKHNQELSYREISEIVGIPEGKVKSRLYIAREKLKDNLDRKLL